MLIDFRERGREGENHQLVVPQLGMNRNLGLLDYGMRFQPTEPHQPEWCGPLEPLCIMVGMQNDATPVENNMPVPQK